VDGLKDGLIDDPRKCSFDPARDVPGLQARARSRRLSHARRRPAIKKVYAAGRASGKPFFPGYMAGSEA
jgi:feruloyl esterase